MNDKLFMRVLGAISSALIIVSVFVPFSTVVDTGLFELYDKLDMIYVPITIIVFGAIGVLAFSINIKTEFAYTTVGAISFFLIMQTMEVLNNGIGLSKFSLGYYFLLIGDLLTLIFTFLSNLKRKRNVSPVIIEDNSNIPISNQNILNNNLQSINPNVNSMTNMMPNISSIQPQPSEINFSLENQMQSPNLNLASQIQPQSPMQSINNQNVNTTLPNSNIQQINAVQQQAAMGSINNQNVSSSSLEPIPELNLNLNSLNGNIPPVAPVIQPQNETVDMPKMNPVLAEFTNNNVQQPQNIQPQNIQQSTNTFLNNAGNQVNTNNQVNSNNTPSSLDIFGR